MNNETNKLIPELRFPEFANQVGWNEDSVNNLFDLQDGYPFSSFDFTDNESNSRQVVRITDINNQNKSLEKVFIAEGKVENFEFQKYKVEKGNLLLSLTGVAGFNFFIWKDGDAFLNQRTMKISAKDEPNQALIILLEPLIYEKINLMGTGQNNNLSKEALKEIKLAIPKPKEQQKIASCLSSLDELITAHTNKLETLKTYKKGLMQNLFPQEGEKVPKLRFKEFEKDGEWIEKRLDEICDINPSIKQLPSEFIYIDLESVDNGILTPKSKITLDLAPSRAQRLLKKEDVIYQMVRPYQMNNYFFEIDSDIEYVASTGYAQLRAFVSSKFLFQLIHTQNFVDKVLTKCTGSNYPAINSSDLKSIKSQIPTEKEQQKIAETLSSLDNLIKEQSNKIEQLKSHKKGLMQGLFPKVNN